MSNWSYNLDMLAQNGVLDFDAPSFIMGQNPRYVGRPAYPPSPFVGQVPKVPALNQPEIDEFKQNPIQTPKKEEKDTNSLKNPAWKKWLFGTLAVGSLIFAGFKFKSIKKWFKNISSKNIKNSIVKGAKSVGKFFKSCWNKFTGLFKKKTP